MIANCLVSCSQYCRWKLYEEKARKLYMTCWVISSCRSNLGPNFHEKNWYQVVNHVVWTHLKAVQIQRAWAWITVRLCTSIWRRKWEFHQIFKRDILIIKDNHARLQNHNQITIRTDPDVEPKFMWSSWGMLDRRASQHGSTLWYHSRAKHWNYWLQQVPNRWPQEILSESHCLFFPRHCMFWTHGLVSCQPEPIAALEPYASHLPPPINPPP